MSLIKNLFLYGWIVAGQIFATPTNAASLLRFGPTQAFASPTSYGEKITVDRRGNSFVVGLYITGIDFGTTNLVGPGGTDVFVAKLSPSGSVAWALCLGSVDNHDFPGGIAVDARGNVCVATRADRISISKYDTSGAFLWRAESSTAAVYPTSMACDRRGNILVAGWFQDDLQIGGTNLAAPSTFQTFFLLKLDPQGKLLWARQVMTPNPDSFSPAAGVSADARGNVYVLGQFSDNLDFGDGVTLTNERPQDVFTAKFSSDGKPLWATSGGGKGLGYPQGIATSPLGFTYITGSVVQGWQSTNAGSYVGPASFVAKYERSGKLRWVRLGTSPTYQWAGGLALDRQGNAYVCGNYRGGAQFGHIKVVPLSDDLDMFVWSLNRFGHSRYVAATGSNGGRLSPYSIATRALDDVVFTGQFFGDVKIGRTNLSGSPYGEAFVSRLRRWSY